MFNFNRLFSKQFIIKYPTPNKIYGYFYKMLLRLENINLCFFMDPRYSHASLIFIVAVSITFCCVTTVLTEIFYILFVEAPEKISISVFTENIITSTTGPVKNITIPTIKPFQQIIHHVDFQYFMNNSNHKPIDYSFIQDYINKQDNYKLNFVYENLKKLTTFFIEISRQYPPLEDEDYKIYAEKVLYMVNEKYHNFYIVEKPKNIPLDVLTFVNEEHNKIQNEATYQNFVESVEGIETIVKSLIYDNHVFFKPTIEKLSQIPQYYPLKPQMLNIASGKTVGEFITYCKSLDN